MLPDCARRSRLAIGLYTYFQCWRPFRNGTFTKSPHSSEHNHVLPDQLELEEIFSDMSKNQTGGRGTAMAEFVVIAAVFFMIVFGIIEFGRLLYTHNALTDAARRGARYAVLHDKRSEERRVGKERRSRWSP